MPLRHRSDIGLLADVASRPLGVAGFCCLLAACSITPSPHIEEPSPGRWSQYVDPSPTAYDLVYYHQNEPYFRDHKPDNGESINAVELPPSIDGRAPCLSPGLRHTEYGQILPDLCDEEYAWPTNKPVLSPGDRLFVRIENGEEFGGRYEVDIDGSVNLPFLRPIPVAGQTVEQARQRIIDALVNAGYFRRDLLAVNLLVRQWATVQVNVSGAVFSPGLVSINVRRAEDRALQGDQVSGDYPSERFVSAALKAAGGVRPDADLKRILLIRQGRARQIDLSGIPAGLATERLALIAGDQLLIPSTGRFDEGLVRPSAITPPGIRLFLSNLTVPATDNSKSAINNFSSGVPYGTRFLSGLVSANCVGGTSATNSRRFGVLVTRNPMTGETEVIERAIHEMLEHPEIEALNPHLMPNDGIACYDSGLTNLRDIGKTIADILLPFRR